MTVEGIEHAVGGVEAEAPLSLLAHDDAHDLVGDFDGISFRHACLTPLDSGALSIDGVCCSLTTAARLRQPRDATRESDARGSLPRPLRALVNRQAAARFQRRRRRRKGAQSRGKRQGENTLLTSVICGSAPAVSMGAKKNGRPKALRSVSLIAAHVVS